MVDCRKCVHCVAVSEGVNITCADGGTLGPVSWPLAVAGWCNQFKERPEPCPATATGNPIDCGGCEEHYAPPGLKPTNPKDALGVAKLPLSLVPAPALAYASLAHLNGALKYGKWNWRRSGVRASVYLDAALRHLTRWENGEEFDPEDGVPNLAAALACINIIIDARACGKLTDDRPPSVDIEALFTELTLTVKALVELHKDRKPEHQTIENG